MLATTSHPLPPCATGGTADRLADGGRGLLTRGEWEEEEEELGWMIQKAGGEERRIFIPLLLLACLPYPQVPLLLPLHVLYDLWSRRAAAVAAVAAFHCK